MGSLTQVKPGVWLPLLMVLLFGLAPGGRAAKLPAAEPASKPGPKQVVLLPWGSGPGQAGKLIREEGAAEGPMSFAVTDNGEIFLLDQLNARIIHVAADGKVLRQLPVPVAKPECREGATFADLAVTADGRFVLLDNIVENCLIILDQDGTQRHRSDLAAFGIPVRRGEQAVGNLAVVDGDVYLEDFTAKGYRQVFDRQLQPVRQEPFPGLPFKQREQFLLSRVEFDRQKKAYRLIISVNDAKTRQALKTASWLVKDDTYLLALAADRQQHLHLVYASLPGGQGQPIQETITWLQFDDNLREITRRIAVSPEELGLDKNISARITPAGHLYLMHFTIKGVQLCRWE
ncbi:MAG: hypothetical protein ACUVRZ_08465 [Desulfobacca sp.]|uniref:hypothetical protein n=1 Tax=Desulfobacca sp. TaxID=2067990 RepID=UPI0040495841